MNVRRSVILGSIFLSSAIVGLFGSFLVGCGGGGGGGGFIGAAYIFLNVQPSATDVGDRVRVRTEISDVNVNGIALKFRFPPDLTYVSASSFLKVDGDEIDVSPTVVQGDGTHIYLVFYFSPDDFGDDQEGTLDFELEALDENEKALIEVDADVDDPNIPNSREFDIDSPEFAAEDEDDVAILG